MVSHLTSSFLLIRTRSKQTPKVNQILSEIISMSSHPKEILFKPPRSDQSRDYEVNISYSGVFNSQLSHLKKEDVIALGKAIDGFLSSDVGKMTQAVVFAAFPEMKVVKDVAMPVMRQFIKKVTD